MDKIIRPLVLILLIAAGIAVWDGFFILPEGQQAVITQFGAPVGAPVTKAGLKFKTPFIQVVQYFDKRILVWDGDPNQIPTNDKTFIYMDNTARWRISDPLRFLQAVGNERRATSLLNDILAGTVRDLVNKNDLIEIIRSSDWSPDYMAATVQSRDMVVPPKVGRDKISQMVLDAASKITPQYGIELLDVMFTRVNYIESVRLKVYDRMISERKRIAAEKRSTGEGRKAEILGRVDRELQEITSTAKREATEIRGKADAEAAKIYAQAYSSNPEFFAFQKSLESYRSIIGKNTSLVLSADSDLFRYLERQRMPN
ncbi:protease FtsH subunit HflC [Desulfobulbus propionicus DSM 2032]|jgi:membrane protease subunit HflC|uniref:Protein HflC n=1 Tax=Desulfobulbus propionicus (strain ATCC 33891 / DSM 2032 / VKM B-1956 / 1pr3) TaxID=577650 RepID=A0A7U4DNH3_DESPD|nr:protease modulator HflC [Desulfobulbus propionicus]ADW16917.1 protease FtsH subunit HflC [Desulfobulbus propionicus DSM 2032]